MMIKTENDHLQEDDNEANGKRRRVQRACDVCRKKKIRCDGLQPEKGACSNCASYGLNCTFADAVKRRAPPRSYVIALEARMEKAEEVIAQLAPYLDTNKILGPMPLLPSDKREGDEDADSPPPPLAPLLDDRLRSAGPTSSTQVADDSWEAADLEEEDEDAAYLRTSLNNTSLSVDDARTGISIPGNQATVIAKSSPTSITKALCFDIKDASGAKRSNSTCADEPMQFIGRASGFHILPLLEKMSQDSNPAPLMSQFEGDIPGPFEAPFQSEEPDYSKIDFRWPTSDLQQKLLEAYFSRPNRDMPLLNEVIVRRMFSNASWPSNGFQSIAVALGIFCVASRYVDDQRLTASSPEQASVALHWFKELQSVLVNQFPRYGAAVPYLQATLLSTIYMSAIPKSTIARAWVSLSLVVRMLEDSGAHRKFTAKRLGYSLVTEETYKRMWWITYVLDRQLSSELGRPMSIQDEDFDLEEILLVNDEHLVKASEAGLEPIQPLGELCVFEGFLQTARLSQVIGRTLRTIYAISKSKISRGFVGRKWDALVVADIDKSLTRWLEDVPDNLRYNPNEINPDVLMQSSRIYVQYYHAQTLIHRPFIQNEKMENNDLTFKSLAIVSNAARSAIHIIYNIYQRGMVASTSSEALNRTFAFGCMLLFISWSAHLKNVQVSKAIMSDVYKCIEILHAMRIRWSKAAEMGKMLEILIQRSQVPVNTSNNKSSSRQAIGKRGLEEDSTYASDKISTLLPIHSASREHQQRHASNLPLSTVELQSSFSGESPDSNSHPDSTSLNSIGSQSQSPYNQRTQEGSTSTSDLEFADKNSLGRAKGHTNYSGKDSSSINANVSRNGSEWPPRQFPNASISTQTLPPFTTDNTTSMDSTIFDPNRTLNALFNGNSRLTDTSQYSFGTPSANTLSFDNLETFQGSEMLGQTDADGFGGGGDNSTNGSNNNNNLAADPLDALANMQSLWSDVDWMRALEFQQ